MGKFENSLVKSFNPALQSGARSGVQAFLQRQRMDADADEKFQEYMRKDREKQQKNIWLQKLLTDPSKDNYIKGLDYFSPGELNSINKGLFPEEKEKEPQRIHDETLPNGYQARSLYGVEDPEGNYEYDGKKWRVTRSSAIYNKYKRGEKGTKDEGKLLGYSPEVEQQLKGYKKDVLDLKARHDAIKTGATIFDSKKLPIEAEDAGQELDSTKKIYKEYVKNILPPDAKKWNDDLEAEWQGTVLQKGKRDNLTYDEVLKLATYTPPPPQAYVENLMAEYLDKGLGKTEEENYMALRGLSELFIATYGYSPIQINPHLKDLLDARF